MGISTSKVYPINHNRLMANNIVIDRSGLATVPTPRSILKPEVNSSSYGISLRSTTANTAGSLTPSTGTCQPRYPVEQYPFRQTKSIPELNDIKFRTPCRFLRKTTVRVQPKYAGVDDSEVINISDESLSDGDIIVETPAEKICISKVKRWQIFPGHAKFWWDGRFVHGPDRCMFYASLAVIQLIYGGFSAFVLPFLMEKTPMLLLPIITAFSYFCVMSTMLYSAYSDPGILPRSTLPEILLLMAEDDEKVSGHAACLRDRVNGKPTLRRWCTTCCFYKPPRATHCRTCDNCVERFDHHCPFVGNCVGQRNYPTFIMFLFSVVISCTYVIVCCCIVLYYEYEDGLEKFFLPDKPTIASWLVGMASAGVFVAVGILYAMHLFLICQDKTTNEDHKFLKRTDNPFYQRSICKNWFQVMFTPRLPSLIQRRAYVTREFMNSLYYQKYITKAISEKYGAEKDEKRPKKPPVNTNAKRKSSKKQDNQDKADYPKQNYHIEAPKSNTKEAAKFQNSVVNSTKISSGYETQISHASQATTSILQESSDSGLHSFTDEYQYLSNNLNLGQPHLYLSNDLVNNFRFKVVRSTETIEEYMSNITNAAYGINPSIEVAKQNVCLSHKSNELSLPFKINKDTVLVDRIFTKQLITPTKLEGFENTEKVHLPHNRNHLPSRSICRNFGYSQPRATSFADNLNRNSNSGGSAQFTKH